MARKSAMDRFLSKCELQDNGCILWTGALQQHSKKPELGGYAKFKVDGKMVYAHRWIWSQYNGRKIKRSREIDHHCETRHCVNPLHLEEVTKAENVARIHEPWRRFKATVKPQLVFDDMAF